jgi:hypothetical protein
MHVDIMNKTHILARFSAMLGTCLVVAVAYNEVIPADWVACGIILGWLHGAKSVRFPRFHLVATPIMLLALGAAFYRGIWYGWAMGVCGGTAAFVAALATNNRDVLDRRWSAR